MYRLYRFSNQDLLNSVVSLNSFRKAVRLASKHNGYWVILDSRDCSIVSPKALKGNSLVGKANSKICQRFRNETKDRKVLYT